MGKRNRERVARIKAGLEEHRVKRKAEVEDPNRFMFTRKVAREVTVVPKRLPATVAIATALLLATAPPTNIRKEV